MHIDYIMIKAFFDTLRLYLGDKITEFILVSAIIYLITYNVVTSVLIGIIAIILSYIKDWLISKIFG